MMRGHGSIQTHRCARGGKTGDELPRTTDLLDGFYCTVCCHPAPPHMKLPHSCRAAGALQYSTVQYEPPRHPRCPPPHPRLLLEPGRMWRIMQTTAGTLITPRSPTPNQRKACSALGPSTTTNSLLAAQSIVLPTNRNSLSTNSRSTSSAVHRRRGRGSISSQPASHPASQPASQRERSTRPPTRPYSYLLLL